MIADIVNFTLVGAGYIFIPLFLTIFLSFVWATVRSLGRVWSFHSLLASFGRGRITAPFIMPTTETIPCEHTVCYKTCPLWLVGTQTGSSVSSQGCFTAHFQGSLPALGESHTHVFISSQLRIQGSPMCLSRALSRLAFCPASSLWPPRILDTASSTHRNHQALSGLLPLPARAMVCKLSRQQACSVPGLI